MVFELGLWNTERHKIYFLSSQQFLGEFKIILIHFSGGFDENGNWS